MKISSNLNTGFVQYIIKFQTILVLLTLIFGIWAMPATKINPDTYYYITKGAMFENCKDSLLRDAYTVGFILPAIFQILHLIISESFDYLGSAIIFSKVLICCIIIFYCYQCLQGEKFEKKIILKLFLLSFLFYYWTTGNNEISIDTGSLNAEYICVLILILIINQLENFNNINHKIYIISILVVLLLNTKLQAIPILFGLLLVCNLSITEKIKVLFLFLILIFLNYIIFKYFKIETLFNFDKIIHYIKINPYGSTDYTGVINQNLDFIKTIFIKYKIIYIIIIHSLLMFIKGSVIEKKYAINLFILFTITIFVILLPNKQFEHYQIFLLVPIFFYIKNFYCNLALFYNKLFIVAIITISILLTYSKFNNFKYYLNSYDYLAILNPYPDDQIIALKENNDFKNKRIYVNGWDYSIYSYLKSCRADEEYSSLIGGVINQEKFYENILKSKYDYIVDITYYTSWVNNDFKNSLLLNESLQNKFMQDYNLVYYSPNLYVLKVK